MPRLAETHGGYGGRIHYLGCVIITRYRYYLGLGPRGVGKRNLRKPWGVRGRIREYPLQGHSKFGNEGLLLSDASGLGTGPDAAIMNSNRFRA